MIFNNKTLLITGGTGSFGNAVLRRFLDSGLTEIRILSRDEKKQDDMRKQYSDSKLTNKFFESKLKITATTRNWKTVIKLNEIAATK